MSNITVRYPEAGEVLYFRPHDGMVSWYFVHTTGGRVLPCVGAGCPRCNGKPGAGGGRWEGYLYGHPPGETYRPLVLRLTAKAWWLYLAISPGPADLRPYQLRVERRRAGGWPSCWVVASHKPDAGLASPAPDLRAPALLLPWWNLDGAGADLRQAIVEVAPRAQPCRTGTDAYAAWDAIRGAQPCRSL